MSKRLEREKLTVRTMLKRYCKDHHQNYDGLCPECQELEIYAMNRLSHCKFGDQKPTCGKCTVHCYKPDMRQRMIGVMRYSGPKMVSSHPFMAIRHLIDGMKSKGK
jgi:hypothetical protein